MVLDKETAQETAEFLLQIKAIKLNIEDPFTWASGIKSPIYCDNRIALSYPHVRNHLRDAMRKKIEQQFSRPDAIAGVATGAIGLGILVAEAMGLPFVYIRPKAKEHGRKNQIEGYIEPGQSVIVIEDLISTGKSSFQAISALKDHGVQVKGMVAIFTYNFDIASSLFEKENIEVHTLSDYNNLIEMASKSNYIAENTLDSLLSWRSDPIHWKP
tara:strand:- start:44879 stop:45520 length:642 start_codon:yes stop_codon:yes gene_type:complete